MSMEKRATEGTGFQDSSSFVTTTGEKKTLTTFLIIGFAVLLFATFFDKDVSRTFMDQNSFFGNLFQNYANQGPNIVLFAVFEILAWISWERVSGNLTRYAMTTGLLAFAFNQMLVVLQDMFTRTATMIYNVNHDKAMGFVTKAAAAGQYPDSLRWAFAIALTFLLSIAFKVWISHQDDQELTYLLKAALIGVAVVYVATTTIDDMKTIWGRFRPYEMTTVHGEAMSQFTPWYHLNGNNHHTSFPSGHTMSGWLFLYLAFLVPRKNISRQKAMTIFGIAMGILTGLSRVRIGAHWLSDVTASSLIVGLIIFFASRLLQAHYVEADHQLRH
ncbi:membrane-associated phospholipid phosphatase [Fructobacillus pseudoficulneus]|uniref:Membrane-associated phospholipid phosphatase n=1 Tax=Fructobacillus pseudoficulneus TaxID=220714 RepID=A0A3F3GX31_9LACO|nr:phosphatase PAP2 family protein [Fructobacillus pseudoficulneus]GAP02712.1 membrane-associated phospholipid phosphatase [Fructobacillus pseudoficulneus]SEH39309.1 PAP2 superfamily protein [Fructobacillus pseudoficulneus]